MKSIILLNSVSNFHNPCLLLESMRAEYVFAGPVLRVIFSLNPKESVENTRGASMAGRELEIRLTEGLKANKIHNDHLALITILSVHPFVRGELYIDLDVSLQFSKASANCLPYNVVFNDNNNIAY